MIISALLMGGFPKASAAEVSYTDGAKPAGISLEGSASNVVWKVSDEVVHRGNYSVFVGAADAGEYDEESALVFPFAKTLTPGTAYRLSFYTYRGTEDKQGDGGGVFGTAELSNGQVLANSDMTFYLSDNVTKGEMVYFGQLSQAQETDVWAKTTVDFTPTSNVTGVKLITWNGARYFDDICVYELSGNTETGRNLVMNGGCETALGFEKAQFPTGWLGIINQQNDNSVDFTNPNGVQSTAMDAHSGKRSMFINISASLSKAGSTGRFTVDLTEKLKANTKYKLEYWQKNTRGDSYAPIWGGLAAQYPNYIVPNLITWKPDANSPDGIIKYDVTENNWRKQEVTWNNKTERTAIGFVFWDAVSVLIDDVKLYELDSSGNVVKEVFVPNGDFELYNDFYEVPKGDATNSNWSAQLHGITGSADDYVRFEEVEEGNFAMHIRYNKRSKGNVFLEFGSTSVAQMQKDKWYSVEYDVKQCTAWGPQTIRIFPFKLWDYTTYFDPEYITNLANCVSVTYNNGWYHVKKSFISRVDGAQRFTILLQDVGDAVFDNIKVYSHDNPNVNLVKDGDFSETKAKVYNRKDLANVTAYPVKSGNAVNISWTNAHNTIENAEVYLDGIRQAVNVNCDSDAFNEVYIDSLTPGQTYEVLVKAEIGGAEKEYRDTVTVLDPEDAPYTELDYADFGLDGYRSDVWKSYVRDGDGYANAKVSLAADGDNAYAQIKGNMNVCKKDTYAGIEQTVKGLDSKKSYKLKFRAKSDCSSKLHVISDIRKTFGNKNANYIIRSVQLTDEWADYEAVFDYSADGRSGSFDSRYLIIADKIAGSADIDDIELYEVNGGSDENLIADGKFDGGENVIFGEPVITKDGKEITSLSPGSINIAVDAENSENMTIVIAVYKDGALCSISFMEKNGAESEKYDTSITIPDEEGVFTAKVMYWNRLSGVSPLRTAFGIK